MKNAIVTSIHHVLLDVSCVIRHSFMMLFEVTRCHTIVTRRAYLNT